MVHQSTFPFSHYFIVPQYVTLYFLSITLHPQEETLLQDIIFSRMISNVQNIWATIKFASRYASHPTEIKLLFFPATEIAVAHAVTLCPLIQEKKKRNKAKMQFCPSKKSFQHHSALCSILVLCQRCHRPHKICAATCQTGGISQKI